MFLEKVYKGKNEWYLYIFSLLLVFLATQIGSIPLVVYAFLKNPTGLSQNSITELTNTNLGLMLVLLSFVAGFFSLLWCIRQIHHRSSLDLMTGRKRIDWGRIFFGTFVWGGLSLLSFAITILLYGGENIVFQFDAARFAGLFVISLFLFPFQTSFEELLFRGYLMQWSALLFKYRWIAIAITGILFGIMHLSNPEIAYFGIDVTLPQYIIMGLLLGYVAVVDDGLELVFGLHFANNFLAAVTFTSAASTLQTPALFRDNNPVVTHSDWILMLIIGIIFVGICHWKYGFLGKVNIWQKITPPME